MTHQDTQGAELLPEERTGWYRFTGIAGLKRYVPAAIYDRWVAKGRTGYTKWYEPYPCICPKCDGPLKASSPEAVGEAVAWGYGWYENGGKKMASGYLPTIDYPRSEYVSEGPFPLYRHPVAADRAGE